MMRALILAGVCLTATPAFTKCLPLGKTLQLTGQVFAFESGEDTAVDTSQRLREIDSYAMLLPEKACFGAGKATLHNLTLVGLKGDAEALAALAKTPVRVTGKLVRSAPDADPQIVMTVKSVQPLKVE